MAGRVARRKASHDLLFEPLALGPKTLKNRFFQVPHSNGFGTDKPGSQSRFRAVRADGGWGAVCEGITSIYPESDRVIPPLGRLWDDDDAHNLSNLCREVHAFDCLVGLELFYSGPHSEGSSRAVAGAPSQLPSEANPRSYPRELSLRDIEQIQRLYVEAALRAERAGVDIIYVYGSHGYLPAQFLSPFYNHRDDSYGGSLREPGAVLARDAGGGASCGRGTLRDRGTALGRCSGTVGHRGRRSRWSSSGWPMTTSISGT